MNQEQMQFLREQVKEARERAEGHFRLGLTNAGHAAKAWADGVEYAVRKLNEEER